MGLLLKFSLSKGEGLVIFMCALAEATRPARINLFNILGREEPVRILSKPDERLGNQSVKCENESSVVETDYWRTFTQKVVV